MSRTFEGTIQQLAAETGYDYDFLIDRYLEVMAEDGDYDYFVEVTKERDW